ncbi:MAG: hypothetical protein ACJAVY_002544, partial [Marinoscillum sp.]
VASSDFVDEVYSYLGEAYQMRGEDLLACNAWQKGMSVNESRSQMYYRINCDQ